MIEFLTNPAVLALIGVISGVVGTVFVSMINRRTEQVRAGAEATTAQADASKAITEATEKIVKMYREEADRERAERAKLIEKIDTLSAEIDLLRETLETHNIPVPKARRAVKG